MSCRSCITTGSVLRMVYHSRSPSSVVPSLFAHAGNPANPIPLPMLARHEPNGSGVGLRSDHGFQFAARTLSLPTWTARAFDMPAPDHGLKIFSTCPVSAQARPESCIRELQE